MTRLQSAILSVNAVLRKMMIINEHRWLAALLAGAGYSPLFGNPTDHPGDPITNHERVLRTGVFDAVRIG